MFDRNLPPPLSQHAWEVKEIARSPAIAEFFTSEVVQWILISLTKKSWIYSIVQIIAWKSQ